MQKNYKYYDLILGAYVCVLLCANLIGPAKVATIHVPVIGAVTFMAGVLFFPISYVFGDVLTEVYGYARARQVIWTGFFCNLVAVIAIWIGGLLPSAPFWSAGNFSTPQTAQGAYQAILGFTPRLLLASFIAYLIGEFLNSFVLAKLKLKTAGRFLWIRTIGSTLIGQGADSAVFITIAFAGIIPGSGLLQAILSQWFLKTAYETIATPLTYIVVNALKKVESEDYFDRDTDFNPFIAQ